MERAESCIGGGRRSGMHIAIAIQALGTLGGKERDALAIAGGLAARGNRVTIVTRSAGLQVPSGVVVRRTGTDGWTNHGRARFFARAVAAARSADEFDALLSFDKLRDADAYYAADACFACLDRGLKAWLPRYATYARLEADCFSAGGPDILFLCGKQEDEYRRQYNLAADRAVVLPPMIHHPDRQRFYERRTAVRQQFGIPASATLAASVGIYPKQKGVDRTIAVLHDVPGLYLLAVGLKDAASVRAMAAKNGVDARARLVGHSDEVIDILGAADLMLHPARLENTGLVILESLLAGVPVIASAVCGFAEYIERFGAGIVLPDPFNAADYVAAIRAAIEPDMLAELKRRARDSAPELRAEGGLERILDLIEATLARRRQWEATSTARWLWWVGLVEVAALPGC